MKSKSLCQEDNSSSIWAFVTLISIIIIVLGLMLITADIMQEIPKVQMCSLELEGNADINTSQYAFYGNFNSLNLNKMTIKVPCDSYVLEQLIMG